MRNGEAQQLLSFGTNFGYANKKNEKVLVFCRVGTGKRMRYACPYLFLFLLNKVQESMEKKRVYFNRMQREVMQLGAHTNVIVAGRGTGKGQLHAATNLRNFQAMPRSTTAFVVPNIKRALTNTLPSMFQHWEAWGFLRGVHWCVGTRPPKKLGWAKPLIVPDNYDNIISFYNGSIGQIITQERSGTANSKSFDFIDIDEAKFIKYDRLKDEVFPANRGQGNHFGDCPWHHGLLITSDLSLTRRNSWFMDYQAHHTPEIIEGLEGIQKEVAHWAARLVECSDIESVAHRYARERLRKSTLLMERLQRICTNFRMYSSLTNLEILGPEYIAQQKRDLPPLVFRTSILCLPPDILPDGFYSSMKPHHRYTPPPKVEPGYEHFNAKTYDLNTTPRATCLLDGDHDTTAPLCIAFDYNANINWLVVGQVDRGAGRLNVIKSFFVKYERKLQELCDDFADYYQSRVLKEVIFYYDSTAKGSNYAVNTEDFAHVICKRLKQKGWRVREVFIGRPMNHIEKHLLINRAFQGQTRLTPYFNEENNEYLLISIQSAGIYNGKKDKRGEKLAETEADKLEARTDGSDAFDTLLIGTERFPQQTGGILDYGGVL